MLSLRTVTNIFCRLPAILFIVKRVYHTIPRDALLEKVNNQEKQNKITFNITYHPVFRDVRKILEELHVTLASDDEHKKVFPDVPMIGFKNNKNLNAHLVRSQLPNLDEVGKSKPCGGKRPPCHLCENMKDTCTFKVNT